MPEITDPALLQQLNGGSQRRAPQPILSVPNPDKAADNARADQGAANDAVRTGIAVEGANRADRQEQRDEKKGVFDKERTLADDFNANKEVQAYRATLPTLTQALAAPKNGQGDLSVIYAYAKIMDPTSVVREGEMDMATATSPWAEKKIQELRGQLDGSGRLTPAARAGLEQEMIRKARAARLAYDGAYSRYTEDARAYGLDPMRVVGRHYGEQFRADMQAYDKARGLGRFSGARQPEMVNGIPRNLVEGNPDAVDWNGPGEGPFDYYGFVESQYGIDRAKHDWLLGFWTENIGNPNLSREQVAQAYKQAGIPEGSSLYNGIDQVIARANSPEAMRAGKFSGLDVSEAEAKRRAELQAVADALSKQDGTAGENGQFDPTSAAAYRNRLGTGLSLNFYDELSGLDAAANALGNFQNPVDAYTDTRDAERLRYEQMNNAQGWTGTGLELAGSLPWMFVGGEAATPAQLARQGATFGAASGFGRGEGLGDSVASAGLDASIGGVAGAAFGKGAEKIGNWRAGRAAAPSTAQRYADAQQYGLDAMTLGDVGGMAPKVIERGLDVQPGSAGVMNVSREKLGGQIETAVGDVANTFGRTTTQRGIGEVAQRGAKGYVSESEQVAEKLYGAIPIAADVDAVTTNTVARLEDLTNKITSNPKLAQMVQDDRLVGYLDALKSGKLSWNDIKQLRTRIGEEIGQQMFGEKTLKSDLRSLYSALSADMEATAAAQGPGALKAFKRANDYYAQRSKRIEDVIAPLLGKDGDGSPEAAAALLQRIAKGGKSSSDLKMLAQVRKTLKPDEWGQVANGFIKAMGQPANSPGRNFAPETFVRAFADMEAGAKNILFGKSDLRANLDRFVEVIEGVARNNGTRNTSNTGMAISSLLGYGAGGIPGLALQSLLSFGGAKLWTHPSFVRWATGYSKMLNAAARTGTVNGKANASQMAALTRLAASNPDLAPGARALQQRLSEVFAGAGPESGALRLAAEPAGEPGEGRDTKPAGPQ